PLVSFSRSPRRPRPPTPRAPPPSAPRAGCRNPRSPASRHRLPPAWPRLPPSPPPPASGRLGLWASTRLPCPAGRCARARGRGKRQTRCAGTSRRPAHLHGRTAVTCSPNQHWQYCSLVSGEYFLFPET
ncbi:hypothetical protein PVAP13_7KG119330, partial [Panicum virgatum]